MPTISRRWLQGILGVIWFVDGILQLKPQMFTNQFISQILLPTAQGQPFGIGQSITGMANMVAPHILVYNFIFAMIQLFIGIMLIFNWWVKGTLIVSFIWTALVWWFSEGFGMMLTGQATFLTGAPGAVLLYGLIGIVVWPQNDVKDTKVFLSTKMAAVARYSLAVLWIIGGLLQLQPAFLTQGGLSGAFSVDSFNHLAAVHPLLINWSFAILMWVTGILLLMKNHDGARRTGFWLSVILALFIWWAGEGFGQMLTPLGTDPNSGPLFLLLALSMQKLHQEHVEVKKSNLNHLHHQPTA